MIQLYLIFLLLPSLCCGLNITFTNFKTGHGADVAKAEAKKVLEKLIKPVEILSYEQDNLVWESEKVSKCDQVLDFINQIKDGKSFSREFKMSIGENFDGPSDILSECYIKRDSIPTATTIGEDSNEIISESQLDDNQVEPLDSLLLEEVTTTTTGTTTTTTTTTTAAPVATSPAITTTTQDPCLLDKQRAEKLEESLKRLEDVNFEMENQIETLKFDLAKRDEKLAEIEAPIKAKEEERKRLEVSAPRSAMDGGETTYGKYIGLSVGFCFVVIAYTICACSYSRNGSYELHSNR